MIAVCNHQNDSQSTWQNEFVIMLPEIEQRLREAFRRLDAAAREDAVADAIVHSLLSYSRLHDRGCEESASASTLAWYAALAVKRGRPAGNRMSGKDPLSRYARLGNGIQVEQRHGNWMELMIEDKRASVPDQVAAELDVGAWFATLTQRMKQVARDLACGFSTSEVAEKHGVTAGRISQMRRSLEGSWAAFQNENVPVLAQ